MIEHPIAEDKNVDDSVRRTVDYLVELGKQHGFQQDRDSILGAVEEASDLLCLELNEEQTVEACDLVLEEQ